MDKRISFALYTPVTHQFILQSQLVKHRQSAQPLTFTKSQTTPKPPAARANCVNLTTEWSDQSAEKSSRVPRNSLCRTKHHSARLNHRSTIHKYCYKCGEKKNICATHSRMRFQRCDFERAGADPSWCHFGYELCIKMQMEHGGKDKHHHMIRTLTSSLARNKKSKLLVVGSVYEHALIYFSLLLL